MRPHLRLVEYYNALQLTSSLRGAGNKEMVVKKINGLLPSARSPNFGGNARTRPHILRGGAHRGEKAKRFHLLKKLSTVACGAQNRLD